jgi:uncharacterized membrane protein YkvA (DUF1232 family)
MVFGVGVDHEQELNKSARSAENFAKDPRTVEILAAKAQAKLKSNERIFKGIRKDVDLLVRLARAWATGKYKDVSVGSVLIVLGALLYLLDPFDVIPDFIPFLGLTDDATVIGLAISRLRHELNKYEDWENEITIK